MKDMEEKLFELYLAFESSEAGTWNRSPQCLYIEYWTRAFIAKHIALSPGIEVCNIGIGAGGWDNFLCDLLSGMGRLTSVEIDSETCELFQYRQKREEHANPSTVICADIMADSLPPASFDVVTVIGSTVGESGNYDGCLTSCWRLARSTGFMMYMDFFKRSPERFEAWAAANGALIVEQVRDDNAGGYAFWVQRGGSRSA